MQTCYEQEQYWYSLKTDSRCDVPTYLKFKEECCKPWHNNGWQKDDKQKNKVERILCGQLWILHRHRQKYTTWQKCSMMSISIDAMPLYEQEQHCHMLNTVDSQQWPGLSQYNIWPLKTSQVGITQNPDNRSSCKQGSQGWFRHMFP